MYYNIRNIDDKTALETEILAWINEAESEHTRMLPEWNEADNYFENDQAPPGFQTDHASALGLANDPTQGDVRAKEYVIFNKVLSSHENILGDFINGKRLITVQGRSPKDRKFARAVRKELEFIQDSNMFWEEAIFPAIDNGRRRGLHWLKVSFDPEQDLPYGRIIIREISCRNILIDPRTRENFFQDKRYIMERQRFLVNEANVKFEEFLEPGLSFVPDRDYDLGFQLETSEITEESCTVYEVQYKKYEMRYYHVGPRGLNEIDERTFHKMQSHPQLRERSFRQKQQVWYVAWYNRSMGVFYNDEIGVGTDTYVPLMHIKTDSRVYPFGAVKYEKNLQDLINVFLSVMLDNAKAGSNGITTIDPESWDRYQKIIMAAMNSHGRIPIPAKSAKTSYPREINPAVVQLFQIVVSAAEDISARHGLSQGEMPKERLAKETVNLLITQDRKSHGRTDLMIRWALTKLARLLYRNIVEYYTEPHWVRITDQSKTDPDYVPINQFLTEQEYFDMLAELSGINLQRAKTAEDREMMAQKAEIYREKFEDENEVRVEAVPIYLVNGQEFNDEQLFVVSEKEGLTPAEFVVKYKPQQEVRQVYVVNNLERDADVDLVYQIDFNYDRDRELKMNRSFLAFDRGLIRGDRLLKDIEYPDPEQAWIEAVEANEVARVGTAVVGNPELYKAVMNALAQIEAKTPTNGKPKKAKETAK